MHKIILSTLLMVSISAAEASYSFIGGETSLVNYKNISSPAIGFKYGIQKGMWRTSLNLDYATNGSDSLSSFIVQADRGILQQRFKDSLFKPHAGFSFGILQYDNQVTDKGYAFGLNTGMTYLLNDAMDLDLTYRYATTASMTTVNSLNSLNLSLHYFY